MIADNQSGRRDGFISHASEDKNAIARPLAEALRRQGYGIWYDESELRLGDSLHDAIERGLATCRFGIVILSPAFLQKQWTTKELEGLFVREIDERRKIILPVWHGIAGDEILRRYPMLAVKKAISTAEGLEAVVREISRVLGPPGAQEPVQSAGPSAAAKPNWGRVAAPIAVVTLIVSAFLATFQRAASERSGDNGAMTDGRSPVTIRIVAAESGRPLSGASVFVHQHGEGVCGPVASDAGGRIECPIQPGEYDLAIRHETLTFKRHIDIRKLPSEVEVKIAPE